MQISIVIGSFNRLSFLKLTIESIRRELAGEDYELIIVDGGSTDGTLRWLLAQKDIITMVQHNRGQWMGQKIRRRPWGYFMNLGFRAASKKYVCMFSDDCLIIPGAIKNGYELFENCLDQGRKVGGIAFYWRNWPGDTKYMVGLTLGDKLFVNHGMYLKNALEDIGYIDEKYSFYHADGDLCLKMWHKGYECIDSPCSYVEHFSHANVEVRNSNLHSQEKDWENYLHTWEGIFYDSTKKNIGSWIYKGYLDPTETARLWQGREGKLRRYVKNLAGANHKS